MGTTVTIKYRSMRTSLVNVPLSLDSQLLAEQTRPAHILLHLTPLSSSSAPSARPPSEAWLGWSGLSASSSLPRSLTYAASTSSSTSAAGYAEVLEIDPEVAQSYNWPEGLMLDITVDRNPPRAKSITVTPVSADDWEIIEQHAGYLEDELLGQLRGARKGEVLSVWVKGRLKVQVRVDDTSPGGKRGAVLLERDTEVYIAPRLRSNGMTTTAATTSPDPPTSIRTDGAAGSKRNNTVSLKVRSVPSHVARTWGTLQLDSSGGSCAFCSADTLERVKRKLATGKNGALRVRLQPIASRGADNPERPNLESTDEGQAEEVEVELKEWAEMPDGHIAFDGEEPEGVVAWDHLRILPAVTRKRTNLPVPPNGTAPLAYEPRPDLRVHPSPLPGSEKVLRQGFEYLRRALFATHGRPLLITGNKGSGKTSIARQIAQGLERDRDCLIEVLYHDVGRLEPDTRLNKLKDRMRSWLEEADMRKPALILLDGLDLLVGPETELQQSGHPGAVADFFCRLVSPGKIPLGVVILCTAANTSSLHPLLGTNHAWGDVLRIPTPDKNMRQEILRAFVSEMRAKASLQGFHGSQDLSSWSAEELDYLSLAGQTEGYSVADLKDLVQAALQQLLIRSAHDANSDPQLETSDFDLALLAFTPASLRGVALHKSTTSFSDIGGLNYPRQILRETLEWPTRYAQIFARCPLRLRSGLLLYGYPGCGKTLLASAVAASFGLNFISVKGPELLNKYIGASEKAVRDLFERASAAKPAVLFFDEFESIAPRRGHDSTGVTDRVVNQLLTEMDGAQGLEGVYVLAATSRPDLIDPALLRPGRLDKSVLCDMPGLGERADILRKILQKLDKGDDVEERWGELAERTEGFSGADLQALVYNAHLGVVHEAVERAEAEKKGMKETEAHSEAREVDRSTFSQVRPDEPLETEELASLTAKINGLSRLSEAALAAETPTKKAVSLKPVIQYRHLLAALQQTRASVSSADHARLTQIYRSFSSDRDGPLPNGEASQHPGTRVSLA